MSESEDISLLCDRDWLIEAIDNIVKNALDHTANGDTVRIEWKALSNAVQIVVKDNGCGFTQRIYTIFSSGFIVAVFQRISKELDLVYLWQKQSLKHIAAPLRLTAN